MKKTVFVCLVLMLLILGCNGDVDINGLDELLITTYRLGYTQGILDALNGNMYLELIEERVEAFKCDHL